MPQSFLGYILAGKSHLVFPRAWFGKGTYIFVPGMANQRCR